MTKINRQVIEIRGRDKILEFPSLPLRPHPAEVPGIWLVLYSFAELRPSLHAGRQAKTSSSTRNLLRCDRLLLSPTIKSASQGKGPPVPLTKSPGWMRVFDRLGADLALSTMLACSAS